MEKKFYSIAIDGPSGSGKSSLAKNLSKATGFFYLDTGALYRTVGLYIHKTGISSQDTDKITAILKDIKIEASFIDGEQRMFLNGEDVTKAIRENHISQMASDVSKIPAVRQFLLELQKSRVGTADIIMDGRDIGTVIIPNADVKIFLCASPEERAKRRFEELSSKDKSISYEKVLNDIKARDAQDSGRDIAPLKPAHDAVMLDNTKFSSPEESLEAALKIIKEKLPHVAVR